MFHDISLEQWVSLLPELVRCHAPEYIFPMTGMGIIRYTDEVRVYESFRKAKDRPPYILCNWALEVRKVKGVRRGGFNVVVSRLTTQSEKERPNTM
jgi:hypothetical protein